MIKIIFWDIGGVLILSNRQNVLENWAKRLRLTVEQLRLILKQLNDQRMVGQNISYDQSVKSSGLTQITRQDLQDLQRSLWNTEYVNQELLDFILQSKDKFRHGIISNNYKEAEEVMINKFKIPKFYDLFVSSSDVKALKPYPKIYNYAISQAGVKPEQCLFIDDSRENIVGAKSIGMFAIQFLDNQSLFKSLKDYIN